MRSGPQTECVAARCDNLWQGLWGGLAGFDSVFADVLLQTCSVYRAMAVIAELSKGFAAVGAQGHADRCSTVRLQLGEQALGMLTGFAHC